MWAYLLSALLTLTASSVWCELHRVESSSEYKELQHNLKRPLGVFYYHHHDKTREFASRTERIMEQADFRMDDYPFRFMDLATVNCALDSITPEEVPACGNQHRQFLLYSPSSSHPEKFSLRNLPDTDAFIAEMVFQIYIDDIHLVPTKGDLDELVESNRGKKDVVFTLINGLGTPDHYEYMVLYLRMRDKYTIAFATDQAVVKELGTKEDEFRNDIWCFRCVEKDCEMEAHFELPIMDADTMEKHLNQKKTPLVSRMNADGTTVHDDVGPDVYRIFFAVVENPQDCDKMMTMMTRVVERCQTSGMSLRVVVADRITHSALLKTEFGIHSSAQLPTVLTVGNFYDDSTQHEGATNSVTIDPATLLPGGTEREVAIEFLPPGENVTEENVFKFVERMTKNPDEHFTALAGLYHIYCVDDNEWLEMQKYNHSALVAICTKDPSMEKACMALKRDFRRLVRTVTMLGPSVNLNFVYLEKPLQRFTQPYLSLHRDGKVDSLEKVVGYRSMLAWLNSYLHTQLVLLTPTGADQLPLPLHSRYDENKQIEHGEEELSNYQEDEIALAAQKVRRSVFYSDDTPSLTDENFEETVNASQLVLAFFYIPEIDDVSYLAQPMVDKVRKMVEESGDADDVKVIKVNCENQHRACSKASVHTFPLIRFYREGEVLHTYRGVLEPVRIHKSLLSYQHPSPQILDQDTPRTFIASAVAKSSQPLIIGWFADENKESALFKEVSRKYQTQMTFAYGTGESTKHLFPHPPLTSTIIAYMQQGQLSQVLRADVQGISEASLNEFIRKSTLPPFGEITVDNFLSYKSLNKSLLVAFVRAAEKTESSSWNALSRLPKEDIAVHDVVKVWMNTETEIGKDIRKFYLGMAKESANGDIVLVNFKRAEVYHYPQELIDNVAAHLLPWVEKCVGGSIKATKYLNVLKFKPLREGFDFLTLIDKNLRYPGDKGKEYDDEEEDDETSHSQRRRFPHMSSAASDKDDLVDAEYQLGEKDEKPSKEPVAFDMDDGVEVSDKVIDIQHHDEL